jgi:hypothetical protein
MRLRVTASNIFCIVVLSVFAPSVVAQTDPGLPTAADREDSPAGHGEISIDYFDSYANDFLLRSNLKASSFIGSPFGAVRLQGTGLDASYNVNNDWTVSGGIRYFTGRYSGPAPNCPTTAPPQCGSYQVSSPQHPTSPFIDDGTYHGALQDWHVGVAWHASIGDYQIVPSATAYIPTHDYPTFGNAIVGQDLAQLLLDVKLSHQFDFTNIYYSVEYGYAFSEHVLDVNTGYQRADLELGWFVTPKFRVDTFVIGRAGFGLRTPPVYPPAAFSADINWYERQRTAQHDYHAVGVGFSHDFGQRYSVSANVQHEYWGDTVYNFKYALEAYLTRSF